MAETEFIIRDLVFKYEGLFNLNEVYKNIKSLLKKNLSYPLLNLNEKTYDEKRNEDLKDTKIKLEAFKKIDDYTKFKISTTIDAKNCKDVTVKNKHLQKGELKVKFESTIEYDYQEKWSGKSIYSKFFRDVYDKYVMGYKQDKLAKQIKEETYIVFNNLRDSLI